MNGRGRVAVSPGGLRTLSVFSQFLLSSCKCSLSRLCLTVSQWWVEVVVAGIIFNYWEQSTETHLTTSCQYQHQHHHTAVSLFKTWRAIDCYDEFSSNRKYWTSVSSHSILEEKGRKLNFICKRLESAKWGKKGKWNMISVSFVIFPIVCTILF